MSDKVKWYDASEVSRDIWDGDIWWWDTGDQIYPVIIGFSPTTNFLFATTGQWGWNRIQPLTEMGGKWTPCIEPEREKEGEETWSDTLP